MSRVAATIHNNAFLAQIYERAKAEGRAEGLALARAELLNQAKVAFFKKLLDARFGPLPEWASRRLNKVTSAQLERWIPKIATATTLESILGRRPRQRPSPSSITPRR